MNNKPNQFEMNSDRTSARVAQQDDITTGGGVKWRSVTDATLGYGLTEAVASNPRGFAGEFSPRKRRNGKASAMDVAKFLIYLSACEDEPDYVSHLRLQKLLYYVQGWSLALRGKPMFVERIEAWAHGPVVKNVYAILADC